MSIRFTLYERGDRRRDAVERDADRRARRGLLLGRAGRGDAGSGERVEREHALRRDYGGHGRGDVPAAGHAERAVRAGGGRRGG